MQAVLSVVQELQDRENIVLKGIERTKDPLARHRYRCRATDPPLHFDEPELTRTRNATLNVVPSYSTTKLS